MAKNIPEILYFQGYNTYAPIDLFDHLLLKVDLFIPFANVINISKHQTLFNKINTWYYCILLSNNKKIYINKMICLNPTTWWQFSAVYACNPDYLYLERLLAIN